MAIGIDMEFDPGKVQKNLDRFAQQSGVPVKFVVADQLRLLTQDLVSRTVELPRDAKQGRDAITRDLNKLFVAMDDRAVMNFFDEDFGNGELPRSVIFNFEGNVARMKGYHDRFRRKTGPRQGRVRKATRTAARHGDLKFVNAMYVPRAAYNRFRRALWADVGKLKAGFVVAGTRLAAFLSGGFKVPQWVTKQAQRQGRVSIDTMRKDGNGFMSATNEVPYAEFKYRRWLPLMKRKRVQDINNQLPKRMKRLIDQFNAGKVVQA